MDSNIFTNTDARIFTTEFKKWILWVPPDGLTRFELTNLAQKQTNGLG